MESVWEQIAEIYQQISLKLAHGKSAQQTSCFFTSCLEWMIWNSFFLLCFVFPRTVGCPFASVLDCKESHEILNTILSHPLCLFPGRIKTYTYFFFHFSKRERNDKGETYIQILPHLLCDWVKNFGIKQKEFKCLTNLKLL